MSTEEELELLNKKVDLLLSYSIKDMSVKEYCDRFGGNVKTIQRKCRTGEIPAQKDGRDWMIKQSWILNKRNG